jgi:hypothetical protein
MKSKFYDISFPCFGLTKAPYESLYRGKSIYIKLFEQDQELIVVDDTSINYNSYIKRLEVLKSIKDNVIYYDFTCSNLSALLLSRCKWVYDSRLKVHSLNSKYSFYPLQYKKIIKARKDVFWLDKISYPFHLPPFLVDDENIKNLYVGIVLVDFCWHIYEFTAFPKNQDRIRL